MKRLVAMLIASVMVIGMTACGANPSTEPPTEEPTEEPIVRPAFDPYEKENNYKLTEKYTEEQEGVDYGTIDEDVKYYSKTAGDYKFCNVLLPPGYDKKKTYPVLYMLHGWMSGYDVHLCPDSYLQILYGNMLHNKRTVPMIIVSAEMYTGKWKYKEQIEENDKKLLAAYARVVQDLPNDLMPFIEKTYPVAKDRMNTAIMGVSQGGTKTLAIGFSHLDRFGYIASFAPDPGAVPTDFLKGTIWNKPLLNDFPDYDPRVEPFFLYLAVGADDPENVEVTKFYGSLLKKLGYRNTTDVVDGYEHDYIFWRAGFYNFLNKIFRP